MVPSPMPMHAALCSVAGGKDLSPLSRALLLPLKSNILEHGFLELSSNSLFQSPLGSDDISSPWS